jgi:hypothetical protein
MRFFIVVFPFCGLFEWNPIAVLLSLYYKFVRKAIGMKIFMKKGLPRMGGRPEEKSEDA